MTKAKKRELLTKGISFGIVIIAFIVSKLMINAGTMTRTFKGQLVPICVYVTMAISLNLVVGFSGELSLGHAGFMSVGCFTGVVVSGYLLKAFAFENTTLRLIIALAAGGVMAGIFGFLIGIPVLRLRGDYLAIVTLAFGEIIKNLVNCIYVSVEGKSLLLGFDNPELAGEALLAGAKGTVKVARIATFESGFVLVLIALIVVLNLAYSRSGRAIMACRDSRIAAESVGINPTKYKMMAFVTAAVLAGMAGALYGLNATLSPDKFKFDQSITVLVFVVLGGIGNMSGSIISATVLTILPEKLRAFSNYRMLVYAVVLIVVMIVTNNAWIKSWLSSIFRRGKGDKKNGN